MKKILKIIIVSLTILCCFTFIGCKEENPLLPYLSELKKDVFEGQSQNFSLKAYYGFKESPVNPDGNKGNTVWNLTFKLLEKETDTATYTLTFNYNGETLVKNFGLSPVLDALTVDFQIKDFSLKEFTVCVAVSDISEEVTLKSVIPEGTISYTSALSSLYKNQNQLIKSYYTDGEKFSAEITQRIIVKDGRSYWYVGITSSSGLKALLIDGKTGEILAIRKVL